MALAGRSNRRGGAGFRWLAVGVVITLLVLLIDASLNSRSPVPTQQLSAATWVDRVLPVIDSSTSEGQAVAAIWSNGLKTSAPALVGQIDQVAHQSAANYQAVLKLRPPTELGGPSGLLEAALLARSKAAAGLAQALTATLGAAASGAVFQPSRSGITTTTTPSASGASTSTTVPATTTTTAPPPVGAPPASEVGVVSQAGSEIQVGDQAYALFASSVPTSLGVTMPPSTWGADMDPYTPQAAQVFLAALQSATVTSPVDQVKIYAVTTNPAPVSTNGALEVIPDTRALTATVVVADTGNQPASGLTVTAAITPAGSGTSSVRDFVDLAVGQAYTISSMGPLTPPQGVPVTLTVTVAGPTGSAIPPVTSTVTFMLPAPPPPTTTTTTPPASSSTTSTTSTTTPGG